MAMEDYQDLLATTVQALGLPAPEIVTPDDRWFERAGRRLHYLEWGDSRQPPVILLHGGSQTAHTWDIPALLLWQDYHLYALDQRGHGDSSWADSYEWEDFVQDLDAFVAHLRLGPFVLVGMSMGGLVAMRYAAEHADAIRAVVLVDVGPESRGEGRAELARFRASTSEELPTFDAFLERSVEFNPLRPREHLRYSLVHSLRRTERGGWTWKYDPKWRDARGRPQDASDRQSEHLWRALGKITAPCLIVRGGDSHVLAADVAAHMRDSMQRAQLVTIERASHTVQGDQPVAFVRAVREFLRAVGAA